MYKKLFKLGQEIVLSLSANNEDAVFFVFD